MRFKLWITATLIKWFLVIIAIIFARGFPPPVWASVCGLAFVFGHLGSEYLFPGGYRAVQSFSRQQPYRRIQSLLFVLGGIGLVLVLLLPVAMRYQWFPRSRLLWGGLSGLALVGFWWLAFALTRDLIVLRHWPHEPIA